MTAQIKKSFCHLCLAECGINITVDRGQFIKISSDPNDKVSQGYVCEKSQMLIDFQHSKDRITKPLKKVNGEFVEITWDQAFDEIVDKLKSIDTDRTLYMAPVPNTFQANILYSYELMARLGAKYITNVFSVEKASTLLTNMNVYKQNIVHDRANTQTLILLGQNTWVTQHYPRARMILNAIKNDNNRTLVVVDPCDTETTKIADLHLKLKPGTDSWLLTALIKTLIDNDWIDIQYINDYTINFKKIKRYFDTVDIDLCSTVCGITQNQILELAKIIYSSQGLVIDDGLGICHGVSPITSNYLISLLYLLTGNINTAGGALRYQQLFISTSHHYFKERLTPVTKQKQILGIMPGSSVADNLKYMHVVIVDNSNPAERLPNSKKFIENLSKVRLVMVLDSFMSETAKLADYVLPTPTFFERTECVNISHPIENTIQISRPVLENTEVRTTNDILESIIARFEMDIDIDLWINLYATNKNKFYEQLKLKYNNGDTDVYYILKNTIGKKYQHHIVSVIWWALYLNDYTEELADSVIAELDVNNIVSLSNTMVEITDKIDLAPDVLFSSLKLFTSKIKNKNYEFVLQAGHRRKSSFNTIISDSVVPQLEVFREDADRLLLKDNDKIILETSLITVEIECKVVDNSQQGVLRLANSDQINLLTDDKNIDYLNPQYKFVFANIRKIT